MHRYLAWRGSAKTLSLFLWSAGTLLSSCTSQKSPSGVTPSSLDKQVQRGRTVYAAHCIACHNSNPKKPGALGPDVAGASRELLEARILYGTYPTGYTPKRKTSQMVKLPHLAPELDALSAYLSQEGK